MNLIPIANQLETSGIGTVGKDIFVNFMPSEIPQGILLRESYGGTKINHYLPGYHKASYMMMVRTNDIDAGRQLIQDAIDALTVVVEQDIEGSRYKFMRSRNLPYLYAPTGSQTVEISVNMDCCLVDGSATGL